MRWPQLARKRRREEHGVGAPGPSDGAPIPGSDAPSSADPGWTALPPIAPTWAARTPLIAPPTQPRPPLTQEPRRRAGARALPNDDVTPEPGRVIGLTAVVRPQPPLSLAPPEAAPSYFRQLPPLRHVAARPLTEHAPLTEATDAYVGEPIAPPSAPAPPVAPATPVPSRSAQAVEASTDAGARFREALANLHNSGLPRYVSPSETSWQAPQPTEPAPSARATMPAPPPPPSAAGEPPRLTHRRNTLAESRRLGLGAPLRRGETDGDGGEAPSDGQSDSEPARAQTPPPPPAPPAAPAPGPVEPAATTPEPPAAAEPAAPEYGPSGDSAPDGPEGGTRREPLQPAVPGRPIADGSAHPTSSAAPLVFRARPGRAALRAEATRAVERAVVTRPPAELAQALRSSHGIDVSDVPVQRDPAATNEARDRRARAFTRGGRVYLPDDIGSVTSATARGLLAHELVHAAQQRRLGTSLPDEHTPLGRALEAEAQHAERMYSSATTGDAFDTELIHAPQPVSAAWVQSAITQHAGPPLDYFDETITLTDQQRQAFREAADQAVQQVMAEYRQRTGRTDGTIADSGDQLVIERQFLDVINAELARRDESPQTQLSERDREKLREMLGQGAGDTGMAPQPRRDSRTAGGFFDNMFGGGTTAGADVAAMSAWGQLFRRRDPNAPQGAPGGAPPQLPGGAGTTPTGTGTGAAGGAAGAPGTGAAASTAAGTAASRAAAQTPQRRDAHTAGGFFDNMFGAGAGFADGAGLSRWRELGIHGSVAATSAAATTTSAASGASTSGAGTGAGSGASTSHAQSHYASAHAGVSETGHLRTIADADAGLDGQRGVSVDEFDLDELALRLYDRLRSRLRRELLVDRERAGLLTDFR